MKKYLLFLTCVLGSIYAEVEENEEVYTVEELKQEVCNALPSLLGWCTREKAENFIDLVLEVKPQVCVEIGVFGGSSLFPVAAALKYRKEGVIIGIDPWDKKEMNKNIDPQQDAVHYEWWNKVNYERAYYSYLSFLKNFELENYCITIRMSSEKAVSKIFSSIDILYIDGNHSEASSIEDVTLYLPKVRQGGYIWFNDSLWTSRQEAVELLLNACDVVKVIDNGNCVLFKKR